MGYCFLARSTTPPTFNRLDSQNNHISKDIHVPNHHLLYPFVNFQSKISISQYEIRTPITPVTHLFSAIYRGYNSIYNKYIYNGSTRWTPSSDK